MGVAPPELLLELRVRAGTCRALTEASYDDWCAVHAQEPLEDR